MVLNTAEMPTGDVVLNRDADLKINVRIQKVAEGVGKECTHSIDANTVAEALLGDAVYANSILLGYAWQKGMVPLKLESLHR